MKNLEFFNGELPIINAPALDQTLRAACPHYVGLSTGKLGVVFHFEGSYTDDELETARAIAIDHDPDVLAPDQEAATAKENKRADALVSLKQAAKNDATIAALLDVLGIE